MMKSSKKKPLAFPPNDHEVGYGKPPVQHRFAKGQSGNPRGRPRKRPANPHEEQMKSVVIEEAYRPITLREGDRVVRMPVIQAVMRSVGLSAAKGNSRAQRIFADLVRWVEGDRTGLKNEYRETLISYKSEWELELDRRERLGIGGPDPLPHPDDIEVDFVTGEARIVGPMTRAQKNAWDELLSMKDEILKKYAAQEKALRRKPDDPKRIEAFRIARENLGMVLSLERASPRRRAAGKGP